MGEPPGGAFAMQSAKTTLARDQVSLLPITFMISGIVLMTPIANKASTTRILNRSLT
jgi:hypothetical protein